MTDEKLIALIKKKPISSSAFIATDLPAPESPLTINSSII